VAQLGARFHGMEEVVGSIPTRSTNFLRNRERQLKSWKSHRSIQVLIDSVSSEMNRGELHKA
jgi:hypothetical protein